MGHKPAKRKILKPSGYDVVNRNRNAIRKLNGKIGKAEPAERDRLIEEKERLMAEMAEACPHDSVVYNPGMKTSMGPKPLPFRFCTSCGCEESSPEKRFKTLKPRKGRVIETLTGSAFAIKLGETLRATGINI